MPIRVRRIYEPARADDGQRVLVDRIWPRGLRREDAHLDAWVKEIAPSAALRKWFGHDPERWDAFRERYERELEAREDLVEDLLARASAGTLTLLFAAKDEDHNNAVALAAHLARRERGD